jgi:AraC family transcriptional regulator of adaptative response / DNA-3-methyladenine glycosylase II
VAGERYLRTLRAGDAAGWVEVRSLPGAHALEARLRFARRAPLAGAAERLRRIFDCGADPGAIGTRLARDPWLGERLAAAPGIRVPGSWDGFELAVRAILGQQVSVAAATRLAGRLVEAYGEPLPLSAAPPGLSRLFPRPEVLAGAEARRLGVPAARAEAIRALARAVARGELCLAESSDPQAARQALRALPGIGPWTAEVIAMRALREPDAFPASDLGLRRALGAPGRPASAAQVARRAEAWRPWRAYAALLLWSVPPR